MRRRHLPVLLCVLLPAFPVTVLAQEPAAKASPGRLVVTTSVEPTRTALAAALSEILNTGARRAEKTLKLAVERDPSCALARAFYGAYAPALPTALRLKELDRALADAARATPPEQLVVKALREIVAGNDAGAEKLLASAQELVPQDPDVTLLRTSLIPEPERRLPLLQASVQRHPDHAASVNWLAYTLYQTGKRNDALVTAERYMALLPKDPNPYDSYGELLQWEGNLEDAALQYRRAVELDPEFTEAYLGLAEVAELRHDNVTARASLEDALAHAVAPEDRVAGFRALAFDAAFEGEPERMARALSAALDEAESAGLPASAAETRWLVAQLQAAAGDRAQADEALAAALKTAHPLNPLRSGWVHAALGNAAGVAAALAQLKASADAAALGEQLAALRAMDAAVRGDVPATRAELAALRTPDLRTPVQALLLVALKKAGDVKGVAATRALIQADHRVSAATAYAALLTREK